MLEKTSTYIIIYPLYDTVCCVAFSHTMRAWAVVPGRISYKKFNCYRNLSWFSQFVFLHRKAHFKLNLAHKLRCEPRFEPATSEAVDQAIKPNVKLCFFLPWWRYLNDLIKIKNINAKFYVNTNKQVYLIKLVQVDKA